MQAPMDPTDREQLVRYNRGRFRTRLPVDLRYTASHFWLREVEPSLWQVGMTRFALRMLGEPVELEYQVPAGQAVTVGQIIGWIEGFKAVTDLYCMVDGEMVGGNEEVTRDIGLLLDEPYRAWLYAVRGQPEPQALDVQGYVDILDTTIDRMLARPE